MITRYFTIKNFRNIGCNPQAQNGTDLCINAMYHLNGNIRDDFSGVVTLIGPNNIGKTNVLDALRCVSGEKNYTEDDVNDYFSNLGNIEVSCVVRDGNKISSYTRGFDGDSNNYTKIKFDDGYEVSDFTEIESASHLLNLILGIFKAPKLKSATIMQTDPRYQKAVDFYSRVTKNGNHITQKDLDVIDELYDVFCFGEGFKDYSKEDTLNLLKSYMTYQEHRDFFKQSMGIPIIPNVSYYNEADETGKEVATYLKSEDIESDEYENTIINALLTYLGHGKDTIQKLYKGSKNRTNRVQKLNLQKQINDSEINRVTSKFNAMFPQQNSSRVYTFQIAMENDFIELQILKNSEYIDFNKQSDGFKWFFAFYFKFLLSTDVSKGSIILLDEPCKTLHSNGIKQFRAILRDTAKVNGLTFVIVTHSPFLVDVDNLDEVRILTDRGNSVEINNFYHTVESDTKGVNFLKPITNALLTEGNTLYNNNVCKIVFVEGITDYMYLTAFKELSNNYKDILFFPLGGISKKSGQIPQKIRELESVSLLLIDGDDTGVTFKDSVNAVDKKNLYVLTLKDVDPNFTTIESLFSDSDRKLLEIEKDDGTISKDFISTIQVKRAILNCKASATTKDNFTKVLNYLNRIKVHVIADFTNQNIK